MISSKSLLFLIAVITCSGAIANAQNFMVPPDTDPQVISAFNEGTKLLSAGQAAEAAKQYAIVVKALPNLGVAHYNYAVALGKIGRFDESIQELEKAVALQANDPSIMANLGTTYQLAGRYDDALAAYGKYLNAFPKGQYAQQISMQMQKLKDELKRKHGKNSLGQDNYLSEAMAGGRARWDAGSMPLQIYIASGSGVIAYQDEFSRILKESFMAWAEASGGRLSISFVDKPNEAAIKCSWTDNPRDLTSPVEGGRTQMAQTRQGRIVKADILILTCNKNLPAGLSESYLRHVCLHEVGHALGLAGHSSQPGDIMFAAASFEAASASLSDRDKKTMLVLYANGP